MRPLLRRCVLGLAPAVLAACTSRAPETASPVTYYRDVAPILASHCAPCHHADGIGPMPLTRYDEARPLAGRIAAVTAARTMPPWPPASEGCQPLADARVLTAEQIGVLERWSRQGAPEGDPGDYVAPSPRADRVLPPRGDLVVAPLAPYAPLLHTGDDYRCFVLDPPLATARDVIGVRVTPGAARIVHHALVYEVRTESLAALQQLDDAAPGEGYPCFGGIGIPVRVGAAPAGSDELADFNQQGVAGWAPGGVPGYFPAGTGIRLHAGSKLVLQVHYSAHGASVDGTDQTRVELYFSPRPVASPALWSSLAQTEFRVPAGVGDGEVGAIVTASVPALAPVRIYGVGPHMHLLGRSLRVDLLRASGARECLLNVPDWRFDWQQSYWFTEPVAVSAASFARDTYALRCSYDNSAGNQPVVDGRRQAPRDLSWGESTRDEMCLAFLYVAR